MLQLHAGAERHLHEVRYVWQHDGVFVTGRLTIMVGLSPGQQLRARSELTKKKAIKPNSPHKALRDRNLSPLESHPRDGKVLKNPFSIISRQMTPRSWVNECIPNILWACILASSLERDDYLRLFRSVAINSREKLERHSKLFITHNYLSSFSGEEFSVAFERVLENKEAAEALRALLLVEALPDKKHWESKLQPPDQSHWQVLSRAIGACFDHQSQRATDIRWIKVIFLLMTGRMLFPREMADMLENFRVYPDRGDMRSVRPSIRAIEISTRMMEFGEERQAEDALELPPPHHERFWREVYQKTACLPDAERPDPKRADDTAIKALIDTAETVAEHFHSTIQHTGLDARHDSSFGIVLHAIHILIESAASYSHSAATGRSTLRSIVEGFITLAYLAQKDDPALWLKHRDHGNGQTKLTLLKNLASENIPRFLDLEMLEALANEDKWLEFHDINVGAWADKNLRTLAVEASLKGVYDSYYDLCSGYTHGHWSAIRETAFTTCFNPLHRFHRIPAPTNFGMRSVLDDGITLVNRMLDELTKLYPGMDHRITVEAAQANAKAPEEIPETQSS